MWWGSTTGGRVNFFKRNSSFVVEAEGRGGFYEAWVFWVYSTDLCLCRNGMLLSLLIEVTASAMEI
ncbi:hypothetical protein BDZ91DRAFT_455502 [Kalaharituber pfeilii]|nr:hypothetical protein BDZ91DRAFT_455502 [Kalaharituber pfeilii]